MRHKIFYDMVKELAKKKNKTIEVVVKEAGITLDSYNSTRRIRKFPRADIAVKIASSLDTSVEFLVTGQSSVFKKHNDKEKIEIIQHLDELEKIIKQYKEKFK